MKVPKHLQEDLQWAIEIISARKLYAGNIDAFKLEADRPEVKAWTDKIYLKDVPVSNRELERL